MSDYQTFNKKRQYVISENGERIEVPNYVDKANNRYRFDGTVSILEKQCFNCKKWFNVAKLEASEWVDTHDEAEYHKVKSGYGSYCKTCSRSPSVAIERENQKSPKEKCSVFLSEKHRRYLKIRAAAQDSKLKDLLYEIIENEMRINPIDKFL